MAETHITFEPPAEWKACDYWLFRVKVAGMDVAEEIVSVLSGPAFYEPIWEEPEIASAGIDEVSSSYLPGTYRELFYLLAVDIQDGRLTFAIGGKASMCMMGRKDGAVYLDTEVMQYPEGPRLGLAYRESRGTEIAYRLAGEILEQLYGRVDIAAELIGALLPDELMGHRVRANLISLGDSFHYLRIGTRNPSDYEECRFRPGVVKYPEDAIHVLMDAHLIPLPLLLRPCGVIVEEMEPLLDIECKYVHLINKDS